MARGTMAMPRQKGSNKAIQPTRKAKASRMAKMGRKGNMGRKG